MFMIVGNILITLFFTLVVYFHVLLVKSFYDDYRFHKEWKEKYEKTEIEQNYQEQERDELLKRIDDNLKKAEKFLDANYPDVMKSIEWHVRIEKLRKDIANS